MRPVIFFSKKSARPVIFGDQKSLRPTAVLNGPVSDKFCSLPKWSFALDGVIDLYIHRQLETFLLTLKGIVISKILSSALQHRLLTVGKRSYVLFLQKERDWNQIASSCTIDIFSFILH